MPRREIKSLKQNGKNTIGYVHHEHRSKKGRTRRTKPAFSHIEHWRTQKEELKLKELEINE